MDDTKEDDKENVDIWIGSIPRSGRRPATLVYTQDKAGKWRWRIKSSNGKIIAASSQGYVTLIDAQKNCMVLGALLGGYNGGHGDRLFVNGVVDEVKLWK